MFLKVEEENDMDNNELQLPIGENKFREVNKEELKNIILHSQNQQQKGYYTFSEWGKLHQSIFGLIPSNLPQTVLNLWRVLKLINFGDDFIPTGLIYDTLVTLMMMTTEEKSEVEKNKVSEQIQVILRTIFFKFIEFNGKYLTEKQKQQLAFFKVIKTVTQGYRKIITSHLKGNESLGGSSVGKGVLSPGMTRNEQLYKMYDVFVYKKNLQKLKKIEEEFKECTFEPDLSYTSRQNLKAQSRYLEAKKIKSPQLATSHLIQNPNYIIPEEQDEEERLFKATPIPYYPQVNPNGLNEHLERMQRSREIKRINTIRHHPSLGSTLNKSVKEFSIEQRDQERRKRMLNSYKILFMIKVEVGKRIYSVKVRQNMIVGDVVRAIEMMVGFKHPEVEQIVKGYFINWQMKIKDNPSVSVKEQYIYE